MVKATDLKCDMQVPTVGLHVTLRNVSKRGVARVTCPLKFWALNANRCKRFKFDAHVPTVTKMRLNYYSIEKFIWQRYALSRAPSSYL